MQLSSRLFLALFFPIAALAQGPARTTIQDTVYGLDGGLANGTVRITNQVKFTSSDGFYVAQNTQVLAAITNGALSVALVPNTYDPNGNLLDYYTATYQLSSGNYTEYWIVPAASPVALPAVVSTVLPQPGLLVNMNQVTPPPNCVILGGIPKATAFGWTCTSGGGGGGSGTINTGTPGQVPIYVAANTVGPSSNRFDDGLTLANTLTYGGAGGLNLSGGGAVYLKETPSVNCGLGTEVIFASSITHLLSVCNPPTDIGTIANVFGGSSLVQGDLIIGTVSGTGFIGDSGVGGGQGRLTLPLESTPSPPSLGFIQLYASNVTGLLTCQTNAGSNCAPAYQTVEFNNSSPAQGSTLNLIAGLNMAISCSTTLGVTSCVLTPSATVNTGFSFITAGTNSNPGTFSASGNSWDFSAASSFKVPVGNGIVPTASGFPAYDSLNNKWVFGQNGATISFGIASSAGCPANQFVNSPATAIASAGCAQPSFTNINGTVAPNQLPSPTSTTLGGIESFAAVSHQWINQISTAGIPSATQPSLSDLSSGTAAATMTFPGGDLFGGGVNSQGCGAYSVATTDEGNKLLTFNCASAVAVTLAQPTTSGYGTGATFYIFNLGAGAITITPTSSTINNNSTTVLNQNQGAFIESNGTNWLAWISAAPTGGGTVTSIAETFTGGVISVAGSPITTSGTLALTISGISGGIPCFTSTTTWTSSALFTANGILYGGGSGVCPSSTAASSTVTNALFATAGAPGWRNIGTSDTSLFWYATDSGLANAYIVNPTPAVTALTVGTQVSFTTTHPNTGGSTINISSLGVKNITKFGTVALVSGDIIAGEIYYLTYDGLEWQLDDPTTAQGTVVSVGETFTGGLITVAGSPISTSGTFALTVAGTSGGIPCFNSASTWTSSAALTLNGVLIGGGAGACPTSVIASTTVTNALFATATAPGFRNIGTSDTSIFWYGVASGSVNALTVTLSPAVTALTTGTEVHFLPNNSNTTTAPTLNVNGLGAKTITKFGTNALAVGDLATTAIAVVVYDGTNWELENPQTGITSSGVTIQTNGTGNTTQTTLNFITSTANSIGGILTPSNPNGGQEKFELTGTINATGGGTGLSNPTAHSLLVGEGTSSFNLVTSPAVNGFYLCGFNVTTSAAVDPSCALQGVPVNSQGANYTLLFSDRASYIKESGGTTSILTLPQVTGNTAADYPFLTQNLNSGNETITANAADKIDNSAVGGSVTLLPNFAAFVYQDASSAPGNWWTLRLPTFSAFGATCTNILSWSSTAGFSCVNATGAMFANFSAHQFLGNSTGTSAAPTPTLIGSDDVTPNAYVAATGTAQAQVANPTPSVASLAAGLEIAFLPVAANTAAAPTLNVSGLGAKTITKLGSSTSLAANDLTTNAIAVVIYDGTEWQLINPQTLTGGGGGGTQTFDSTASGLLQPTGNGTFSFPNTATTGFTLSGTAPASVSTATGTNAMALLTINGVTGGADSNATGTAGVGSSPSISAGAGGAGTGTNSIGGAGGSVNITSGAGGASAGTGNNSNGGNVVVTLGLAGTGGSGAAGTPGQFQITSTSPGSSSGTTGLNAGTIFNVTAVTGGADSNAAGTAGVGSQSSISAGNGGAGTGTNTSGGAGGSISLTAGVGGASLGTGVNANGGSIIITPGTAGSGGSGTAGLNGVVSIAGSTAGFVGLTQGSDVTTANTNIPANTLIMEAPTSVTAYKVIMPGAAGTSAQVLGIASVSGSALTLSWQTVSGGGTPSFPLTIAGTVTSGGIPYFNSTTQESSSALLTANAVMIGGGAGGAPSTISASTTVTNALFATAGAPAFRNIGTSDTSVFWYVAGAGTAQAQTATLSPALTALTAGAVVNFLPTAANTGAAPTLAVNGLTAKSITKYGTTALVANDLTTTAVATLIYDGTEWQLLNPQTNNGTVTSVAETFTGGLISVAGSPVTTSGTFALTVAGTSGGIPYFSSGAAWSSSGALTQFGVVFGGGAGGAPTSSAQGGSNFPLIGQGAANPIFSTIAYPTSLTSGGVLYASSGVAITSSGVLAASALVKGGGAGSAPTSGDVQDISNELNSASSATQAVTFAGGQDASSSSAIGNGVFRGGNQTGAGGAGSTGGGALLEGGTNAATNAASQGGSIELLAGASTGSTQGLQGLMVQLAVYVKGSTVTQWNLECESAAMTITDCAATPQNFVGVAESVGSNTVQIAPMTGGQIPINASAAVTLGHTVCAGSTAGKITDSAGTSTCTNSQGPTVGVVMATAGAWTLPDGTTFTATTTLPLIQLNAAAMLPTAGGGSGTVNNCTTTGGVAYYAATGTAVSCLASVVESAGTITLGTTGSVVGTIVENNATSGSITLIPVTGALGSTTLSLPSGTATIATSVTVPAWESAAATSSAGVVAITAATGQSSHLVVGTCGAATTVALCTLVAGDLPSAIVYNNQANTYTTGLQNFASATMSLPSSAGYAPTTAGLFGYDSTNNRAVLGNGTNTSFLTWVTASSTNNVMVKFSGTVGALTTSLETDNGTTMTYTGTGGYSAPILVSTVSTGTAPLTVTSTTPVANLTLSAAAQIPNLPINQIVSATGAIAIVANGNNPYTINCALTSGASCVTFGETTASISSGSTELQVTTLTTSTSIALQITQGAAGPANSAAPNIINVTAAAAGGAATASNAGSAGAAIALLTGAGSAGGSTTGNGGAGGAFTITEGAGGNAGGTATNAGGNGGSLSWTTGAGGNGGSGAGAAGNGGNVTFTLGAPGTNSSTGTPGTVGQFLISGNAPASTANAAGVAAGELFEIDGVAGGASSNAAGTGGVGSFITIQGGIGGAGTGTNAVGGAGGLVNLVSGAGGASAGTGANANGGNIVMTLGIAGTGGSGAAGVAGTFQITGTSPASVSTTTGLNAGTLLTLSGVTGGADSNAAGTAGTGSGASLTAGAGGAGTGTNTVGGAGGSIAFVTGAGGASLGTGANSNGGNFVVTLGVAGSGGSGAAGVAGTLQITGTAPASVSTATGLNAGTLLTLTGVTGGASSNAAGTAGSGSGASLTGGTGGAGTGTNAVGGPGGALAFVTGNGGASLGTGANSNGGNFTITLGKAGIGGSGTAGVTGEMVIQGTAIASSSTSPGLSAGTLFLISGLTGGNNTTATGTAGAGSIVSISGGAGGAASGATAGTGGAGGAINLTAGAGGAGSGTGVNANGGSIVLTPGAAGTGGSGTAGLNGVVSVAGSTAGFVGFTQGSANTTANTNIPANSIIEQSPTAVTAYTLTKPGAAPNFISYKVTDACASAVCTESFHPAPVMLFVTSDFTTAANTSLQTITGLSLTMPASKAVAMRFHCSLNWTQATSTAAVAFGIQGATTAPTNINANATSFSSTTAETTGTLNGLATTTATPIVSVAPSAITTIWKAEMDGVVEAPSNASPTVVNWMVSTATSGDAVTIKRGSACSCIFQ